MSKLTRDQHGEIFQDELTENQSMPRPPRRDDAEGVKQYDAGIDSQEGDAAMAENVFGRNEKTRPRGGNMDRQRYSDEDLIEREIQDETASPEPSEETEIERRSGPDVIHDVEPYAPRERAEVIYGDTDLDPNREDQRSAHHAEEDEHL
jgi:hypothetical protein